MTHHSPSDKAAAEHTPSPISDTMHSQELYLRISPDKYHYLKFILEGYDNLAVLSSHDGKNGVVRLLFAEECRSELMELLRALAPKLI